MKFYVMFCGGKMNESLPDPIFDGPFGSNLKTDDYVSEGVRVIRLENIRHLSFDMDKQTFISLEKYESLKKHTLRQSDVLFSSFVDENIRVCIYPNHSDQPAINKADCFCIRVDERRCDPRFLLYRLACHSTHEALKEAVHGATRPRINISHLKRFSFNLPSLPEQREIIRRIDSALAHIGRAEAEPRRRGWSSGWSRRRWRGRSGATCGKWVLEIRNQRAGQEHRRELP